MEALEAAACLFLLFLCSESSCVRSTWPRLRFFRGMLKSQDQEHQDIFLCSGSQQEMFGATEMGPPVGPKLCCCKTQGVHRKGRCFSLPFLASKYQNTHASFKLFVAAKSAQLTLFLGSF
ncbi:hypothetical protein ABBQ38_015061 [Trebouxia sp. C0009 RCD-2024]